MRIVLGVGLIGLGVLAAGIIGLLAWAHHMYAVGIPVNFARVAAAYVAAGIALVAGGCWLLRRRRNSN